MERGSLEHVVGSGAEGLPGARVVDPDRLRAELDNVHPESVDGRYDQPTSDDVGKLSALANRLEQGAGVHEIAQCFTESPPALQVALLEAAHVVDPGRLLAQHGESGVGELDSEQVVEHYANVVEHFPQAAIAFSLASLDVPWNRAVGIAVMELVVARYGWEYVFEHVCVGDVHTYASTSVALPMANLVTCARVLGTPSTLPVACIKRYAEGAESALDRLLLEALGDERKHIMSLEVFPDEALRAMLATQDEVHWWDDERAHTCVKNILETSSDERQQYSTWLLEEGARGGRGSMPRGVRAWEYLIARYNEARHEALQDPTAGKDTLEYWRSAVESALLPSHTLRAAVREVMERDSQFYAYVSAWWRDLVYEPYEAGRYMDSNAVADMLVSYASHGEDQARRSPYTYTQSSHAVPVAGNALALFDPYGRFLDLATPLGVAAIQERPAALPSTERIVGMLSALEGDGRYDEEERAVAYAFIYWQELTPDLRACVEEHYAALHLPSCAEHSAAVASLEYDSVIRHSHEYLRMVPSAWYGMFREYAERLYQTAGRYQRPMRAVSPESFAVGANSEYGGKGVKDTQARELLSHLQFDTACYLADVVGFPLEELSRREVFGLLAFLKERRDGLRELAQILPPSLPERARRDRVHALLLGVHDASIADAVLAVVTSMSEEHADALFAQFTQLTRSCADLETYLCETYGCFDNEQTRKTAWKVSSRGLERGAALLHRYATQGSSLLAPEYGAVEVANIEVTLLSDTLHEVRQLHPKISLETLAGVNIERYDNGTLRDSPDLVAQMEAMYRENRAGEPRARTEGLIEKFRARLLSEGSVYCATHNRNGMVQVLSFLSMVPTEGGAVFVSGLNKNPVLEVGAIGRVVLEQAIRLEGAQHTLRAEVVHGSGMERSYIHTYGAVGVGLRRDAYGVWVLTVERPTTSGMSEQVRRWKTAAQVRATPEYVQGSVVLCDVHDNEALQGLLSHGYVLANILTRDQAAVCMKREAPPAELPKAA